MRKLLLLALLTSGVQAASIQHSNCSLRATLPQSTAVIRNHILDLLKDKGYQVSDSIQGEGLELNFGIWTSGAVNEISYELVDAVETEVRVSERGFDLLGYSTKEKISITAPVRHAFKNEKFLLNNKARDERFIMKFASSIPDCEVK